MTREIKDKDYVECLPVLYRRHYSLWKDRMLNSIETIVSALSVNTVEQVMEAYQLTPRDIALLVRLNYFTPEEVERFDLGRIEKAVRQ